LSVTAPDDLPLAVTDTPGKGCPASSVTFPVIDLDSMKAIIMVPRITIAKIDKLFFMTINFWLNIYFMMQWFQ